jgi:VWFA-related protein
MTFFMRIFCALVLGASTFAQSAPDSSTVLITARAKNGAPTDLSAADLDVKVDGKPLTVNEVHRLSRSMLHYCLLFDLSGSERSHLKQGEDDAARLLSKVLQTGDRGFLVPFNEKFHFSAEETDPQELVNALVRERAFGGTAFYDAIVGAADHIAQSAPDRVMFIMSDGEDNASLADQNAVVSALLTAGIKIYANGRHYDPTAGPFQSERGAKILKKIAESTGGKVYTTSKEKDFDAALADIGDDLTDIFAITYTPPARKSNGQLHKLEIKSRKKDISITAPDRLTN